MRAILSVRPKCSHRCVSLKETPLKPVQILKHTMKKSAEQTVMRTKWFKSGQVRPRQGTEICNFGAPSPLEALHWIFCFFSSIYVQFSKTSPLKSGEKVAKNPAEKIASNPVTSVAVMVFSALRFVSFALPFFYSILGFQDTQIAGKKQHEKYCHSPSCVPQVLVKTRT